jgi:hypothetical protein
MCLRGYARLILWMLRRLKLGEANTEELLDVYQKQVRSMMELAVPAWEPNLTVAESMQIERVQKAAFSIILGDEYFSYNQALSALALDTLSSRRQNLSLNFARKSCKHPKYQTWFRPSDGVAPNTRADKTVLKPVCTHPY